MRAGANRPAADRALTFRPVGRSHRPLGSRVRHRREAADERGDPGERGEGDHHDRERETAAHARLRAPSSGSLRRFSARFNKRSASNRAGTWRIPLMPRRDRPSSLPTARSYGRSAMWLEPGSRSRRRRGPRRFVAPFLAVLALAAAGAAVAYVVLGSRHDDARKTAAQKFAAAWAKGDRRAMWALIDEDTKKAYPQKRFNATYRAAERAATVATVRTGPVRAAPRRPPGRAGQRPHAQLRHAARQRRAAGASRGRRRRGALAAGPAAARACARARRSSAASCARPRARRCSPPTAAGSPTDPASAAIAGTPPAAGEPGTGLEASTTRGSAAARAPSCASATASSRKVRAQGPPCTRRSCRRPAARGGQRARQPARRRRRPAPARRRGPRARRASRSPGPQPPGSTFKIITLSAALQNQIAHAVEHLPGAHLRAAVGRAAAQREQRVLRRLARPTSFAISCNSVFAPLGAKLGAKRLVAAAECVRLQREARSVPAASRARSRSRPLKDDLAVGAAAIGQDRDLATPLQMASVGATIANGGVRARPRIVARGAVTPARASCAAVARQVRDDDDRRRARRDGHGGRAPRRRGRGQDRHGRAAPDRRRAAGPEEHRRLVRRLRPGEPAAVAV